MANVLLTISLKYLQIWICLRKESLDKISHTKETEKLENLLEPGNVHYSVSTRISIGCLPSAWNGFSTNSGRMVVRGHFDYTSIGDSDHFLMWELKCFCNYIMDVHLELA